MAREDGEIDRDAGLGGKHNVYVTRIFRHTAVALQLAK